jgi:hypothetical protein
LEYVFIIVLVATLAYSCYGYFERMELKHNGVKVVGTIVHNTDGSPNNMYRLGGNINNPTIRFITAEGKVITGKPILGFISQHEVVVPSEILIIYDRKKPSRFMIVSD